MSRRARAPRDQVMSDEVKRGRPVVSVSGLSKKFCREWRRSLRYGFFDIAREMAGRGGADGDGARLRPSEFWALHDVSFEVGRGESLAVIGANGAGKSTLLKVLYGLIKPDAGRVSLNGRVGAVIELGTGFNPVLSGRENAQVNAAVMGFSRAEARRLMDEITDFAGLGEFIDTPLQYYSSGMQARLAYSVAAHLRPDVLLVDEALAVGDIGFQRKCVAHIRKYLDAGGSLVFVSHNPYHIQSSCRRGIVLEGGRLTFSGTAVEAVNHYFETRVGAGATAAADGSAAARLDEENPVAIDGVAIEPLRGGELWTGEGLRLTLRYRSLKRVDALWGFSIFTGDQWVCVTGSHDMRPRALGAGAGKLSCVVPRLPLVAGTYVLCASITDAATLQPLALYGWQDTPRAFTVRARPSELSNSLKAINQLVVLDVEWDTEG